MVLSWSGGLHGSKMTALTTRSCLLGLKHLTFLWPSAYSSFALLDEFFLLLKISTILIFNWLLVAVTCSCHLRPARKEKKTLEFAGFEPSPLAWKAFVASMELPWLDHKILINYYYNQFNSLKHRKFCCNNVIKICNIKICFQNQFYEQNLEFIQYFRVHNET